MYAIIISNVYIYIRHFEVLFCYIFRSDLVVVYRKTIKYFKMI